MFRTAFHLGRFVGSAIAFLQDLRDQFMRGLNNPQSSYDVNESSVVTKMFPKICPDPAAHETMRMKKVL